MFADELLYAKKHRELIQTYEHIDTLLSQMTNQEYADLSIYLNNLMHMERYQNVISALYSDSDFYHWLKVNDIDLYICIEAIQLSFGILSNLVSNLRNVFAPLRQTPG